MNNCVISGDQLNLVITFCWECFCDSHVHSGFRRNYGFSTSFVCHIATVFIELAKHEITLILNLCIPVA